MPTPKKNGRETSGPQEDPKLRKFFVDMLKDIYWAEKKLTVALPKMMKAASTPKLKAAIEEHTAVTATQVGRLEKVFELLGEAARGKKCEAMEGLIQEGEEAVETTDEGSFTRDVAIVCASQKIEHYEIASYGSLTQLAEIMGLKQVKRLLGSTLDEERQADELLTRIAMSEINYDAVQLEDQEA